MFPTTYRDLAATLCGTLGMLTMAVSLILTPLPAWGDEPGGPEPSVCPLPCHKCGNPGEENNVVDCYLNHQPGTCQPPGVPGCTTACEDCLLRTEYVERDPPLPPLIHLSCPCRAK
jgi:hypothetical protein